MNGRSNRLKGLLGAASILVVGIAIGVATDRIVVVWGEGGHVGEVRIGTAIEHHAVLDELKDRLSLSPDQDARIRAIVDASQASVDTAWSAVREHLEQATDRTIARIEVELDEDQRELLRIWVEERQGELSRVDSIPR